VIPDEAKALHSVCWALWGAVTLAAPHNAANTGWCWLDLPVLCNATTAFATDLSVGEAPHLLFLNSWAKPLDVIATCSSPFALTGMAATIFSSENSETTVV
jgi:hypothetical protein